MTTQTVRLIYQSREVVATAEVADEGDHYGGTIDLRRTPPSLRALFDEFEDVVNGQMFVFLDDIQEKIGSMLIKAAFADGSVIDVRDLQVFPSTGDVSFRLAGVQTRATR